MRRAFTLIELLVVISIIALLIAILLPVLAGARESASRAQCASNSRSLAQSTHVLAADNKGNYRLDWTGFAPSTVRKQYTYFKSFDAVRLDWPRTNGGNNPPASLLANPAHWVNAWILRDLLDVGLGMDKFQCPNRPDEFVFGRTSAATNIFPLETPYPTNLSYAETSYEMLGGRDIKTVQPSAGAVTRAWISPSSPDDPSDLPLNSCMMESGTYFPPPDTRIGSNFGHGPRGYVAIQANVTPYVTPAQGTNVTANDCSTQFVRIDRIVGYRTQGGTGAATGWWNYVDSYDEVNPGYTGP